LNKLGAILLAGAATLGIGAGAFFGLGLISTQAMAENVTTETSADIVDLTMADMSGDIDFDAAYALFAGINEITTPVALPVAESGEPIPVAGSTSVVASSYIENGGTIMVNGKEVLLKDYIYGQEPGADDISKETATDAAVEALSQKYTLDRESLDKFSITAKYYSVYEGISGPVWWVNLYPINVGEFTEIGCYTAILDAGTGEALRLLSAADGQG